MLLKIWGSGIPQPRFRRARPGNYVTVDETTKGQPVKIGSRGTPHIFWCAGIVVPALGRSQANMRGVNGAGRYVVRGPNRNREDLVETRRDEMRGLLDSHGSKRTWKVSRTRKLCYILGYIVAIPGYKARGEHWAEGSPESPPVDERGGTSP